MRRYTPKRWYLLPEDSQAEATMQKEIGVHPIIARMMVQRGLTTPEAAYKFLNPSLDDLSDPFLLPDAEAACERIKQALDKKERIWIHGDYDGDGVTSAALWARCLRSLGGEVEVFVPNRYRDGYDMRSNFVERAKAAEVHLIITTDCGIQRIAEVEQAREAGIDVIITDHHTPNSNGSLPQAVAVVNPHRKDSRYPFPDLAGVGVAFRLCEALVQYLGYKPHSYREKYLDLATIGTVTDVMPLLGENRAIVAHGLTALRNTGKPGLKELLRVAGYAGKTLDTHSIGYGIGPRLNAASRVDETQYALDLLLTKDPDEAISLAHKLNELNVIRQEETQRMLEEAMTQVASQDFQEARCLVVTGTGWRSGIVGLVASQLVNRCNRPCVVIALNTQTGEGRGSARSIPSFNVLDAIDACKDLLIEYGGHAYAAGLSIEGDSVADFASQMNRIATTQLSDEDLQPTVPVVMEVDPAEVNHTLLNQLQKLAPFGNANKEPMFISRGVPISDVKRVGKDGNTLQIFLSVPGVNGNGTVVCPWFGQGHLVDAIQPGTTLDLCYRPQFNDWNGTRKVQYMVEDIRPPEW